MRHTLLLWWTLLCIFIVSKASLGESHACSVVYKEATSSSSSVSANIIITNLGGVEVTEWAVELQISPDFNIVSIWNGKGIKESPTKWVVEGDVNHKKIPVGEAVAFGYWANFPEGQEHTPPILKFSALGCVSVGQNEPSTSQIPAIIPPVSSSATTDPVTTTVDPVGTTTADPVATTTDIVTTTTDIVVTTSSNPDILPACELSHSVLSSGSESGTFSVRITNNGEIAISEWSFAFNIPEQAKIKSTWNGVYARSKGVVTVSGGNILSKQTQETGFYTEGIDSNSYSPNFRVLSCLTETSGSMYTQPTQTTTASRPTQDIMTSSANSAVLLNYLLGTQTIAPHYSFSSDDKLVETAKAIKAMGSNILKINLSPPAYGIAQVIDPYDYVAILRDQPSFRQVVEMDFTYIMMWIETAGSILGPQGFTQDFRQYEYDRMFKVTKYLLETYSNTDKMFFLGHWEGDWRLTDDSTHVWAVYRTDVSETLISDMTDWLNVRQQAVDDAKQQTPHNRVNVFHYVEVNLVETARLGYPRITNRVLPNTNVDFVSYSAYDSSYNLTSYADMKSSVDRALSYIEGKMKPKDNIPFAKRVFIGEYGFPFGRFESWKNDPKSKEEQELRSRWFMQIAIEWGCPFILYWQMYDNEFNSENGSYNGFWLIDNHNVKQPIYETHYNFYLAMDQYITQYQAQNNGALPPEEIFQQQASSYFSSV
eukprot:Nk52_evm17s1073 gene=Nk52_evmTU17s1073